MKTKDIFYRLALHRVKGIGPLRYRRIVEGLEDLQTLFSSSKKFLKHELSLPTGIVHAIANFNEFNLIENEIELLEKHRIKLFFFDDPDYPPLLKNCQDAPSLLFFQGNLESLKRPALSFIGTRYHTDYGRKQCAQIIQDLSSQSITIVSGLAYGIDALSHQSALEHNLPTIGVLAHGLGEMYPYAHKSLSQKMLEKGGLISEYFYHTKAGRDQFPSRNRIVAGMSQATVIIETDVKGGSMITAEMAYSYNRDVFCVPGRIGDSKSAGCHLLIKQLKGQLITGASDILEALGWNRIEKKATQRKLFIQFNEEENQIIQALETKTLMHIDDLFNASQLNQSQYSSALLSLEMQGILRIKPGKMVTFT